MTDYKAPERNPITQDSCAAWLWRGEWIAQESVGLGLRRQSQRLTHRHWHRGPLYQGEGQWAWALLSAVERDIITLCRLYSLCLRSTTAQTHPLNSLCPTYFTTWIYMHPANCSLCLISRNLMVIKYQPAISAEWERERQAESRAWKEREKAAVF